MQWVEAIPSDHQATIRQRFFQLQLFEAPSFDPQAAISPPILPFMVEAIASDPYPAIAPWIHSLAELQWLEALASDQWAAIAP